MPSPERDRIVAAEILDPQGRNRKRRPVAIVTATEEIRPGEPFVVVGITSSLPPKLSDEFVLLPYHKQKHPRTGLKERCAAKCNWLVPLREEDIKQYVGIVPDKQLLKILETIDRLTQDDE